MYPPPSKVFSDKQFFSAIAEGKTVIEMAKIFGVNRSSIYKRIRKYNIKVPFQKDKLFNDSVFNSIDTEEKAYWLGFIFADGYLAKDRDAFELSLKGTDFQHLQKFSSFLGYDKNLNKVKIGTVKCDNKLCARCRIAVYGRNFTEDLKKYGCTPQKSLTLTFPSLSIFGEKRFVYDFIRGYVDGDGSIVNTGKKYISPYLTILGTYEFLSSMISALNVECGNYKLYQKYKNKNTYQVYFKTGESRRILDLLYGNSTIYLDRKFAKYRFAVEHSNMFDNDRTKTVKAETLIPC